MSCKNSSNEEYKNSQCVRIVRVRIVKSCVRIVKLCVRMSNRVRIVKVCVRLMRSSTISIVTV